MAKVWQRIANGWYALRDDTRQVEPKPAEKPPEWREEVPDEWVSDKDLCPPPGVDEPELRGM